jgi:hypothetical protein
MSVSRRDISLSELGEFGSAFACIRYVPDSHLGALAGWNSRGMRAWQPRWRRHGQRFRGSVSDADGRAPPAECSSAGGRNQYDANDGVLT